MNKKFFITTAIPYVNAKPHVGHALEFTQADVIKRFHKLLGEDALLLSGSDENALKNVQAAEAAGVDIQTFVDENSKLFQHLAEKLNVEFDAFQKGSSKSHFASSQELWKRCSEAGDIYKKEYSGLYCVGCELFYEAEELNENGECFEHPGKKLETVAEENYFFKLSKYESCIRKLIEEDELKIIPQSRKNEVLSFLKQDLKDISISRSNARAKNWGVPIPEDNSQRMYVWFDALNIYRSGLTEKYEKFWPADVHIIGKGITRFHAIYWPAFLLSAKLPLPKSLFVHGYLTVDGQKMSKTIGNVIDPIDLIEKYGAEALRYYFLREIPSTEDGNFSEEKLKTLYNADLANGLGNLVARVAKLAENVSLSFSSKHTPKLFKEVETYLNDYRFNDALSNIWGRIKIVDQEINQDEPWKIEDNKKLEEKLWNYSRAIRDVAFDLQPFLPQTAEKILKQFSGEIKSSVPLFPRFV
ncbi:MAG: methionine--tRNA ligase [Candidatus Levybacteria bacterium CG_4_10_14_0_2_um_filter_36_16]|nr:MAG: methionine--tRNA ligase [Candidatus Levybacteria bacterium CG2_30_37_29]PIR79347.1 MAG: methionine--tRNA ligase [Candidatus Levybacteria bacterium CG10_big_fil_rev_8_21_14_0_10_36_30]PIZ96448.1 MAG: methionine--tRNA ligase [Candidatus Levybacteria bacterium CG_4_10_14_0_2_um_filter_36_16]